VTAQSTPQILIIDDSKIVRGTLIKLLADIELEIFEASDGDEGCEILTTNPKIELVLCDLQMPRMNGLDFLRYVRETSKNHQLPIIIVTASREKADITALFEGGASDYICKPPVKEELQGRLRSHLERFRLIKQSQQMIVEIEEAKLNLERRVEERTAQLEQLNSELMRAKETAENAARAKQDFLANTSHEIRTPLHGILGLTEMVMENPSVDTSAKQNLKMVYESGKALLRIINDILDFSKIEAGKFEILPRSFSLRRLVDDVVMLRLGEARGIEVTLNIGKGVPDALFADDARLRQVLVNLVGNATKFTSDEGAVIVHVLAEPAQENETQERNSDDYLPCENFTLRFAVSDNGIGVASEKLERIFESFSQADASTTRNYGGTGLGLAISKKLVELMGGKMWVTSRVGIGSTFHFAIPVKQEELEQKLTAEPSAAKSEENIIQGKRILVVDDVRINQRLIVSLLNKRGAITVSAENGLRALEEFQASLKSEPFDLILMDWQMPVMSGLEATEKIRSLEQDLGGHVPIIALTANALIHDSEVCREVGMDDYLSKPFTQEQLFTLVGQYLEK
jgi:signal transduction histidine kinase